MLDQLPVDLQRELLRSLGTGDAASLRTALRLPCTGSDVFAAGCAALGAWTPEVQRCVRSGCGAHTAKNLWYWDEATSRYACVRCLPYCPRHVGVYRDLLANLSVFYCVTDTILEEHQLGGAL